MAGVGGETAALGAEYGQQESEEDRAVRTRRNQETTGEIVELKRLEKVKHTLQKITKRLERTQLQKISRGPIRRVRRKRSFARKDQRHHHHHQLSNALEKRRKSWTVGQFGSEGVKDRRKSDEEELKTLRSMGVVKRRLKEKDRVREQAVKFFKHRYQLDPESTQKSNCILVTGYEDGAQESVSELIRQQSTIVINNFFNQPTPAPTVLSRLTSSQQRNIEGVVTGRRGRLHHHSSSEPYSAPSNHRGTVMERVGESVSTWERNGEEIGDDGHMIPEAPPISSGHTRTISAPLPSLATPLSPPTLPSVTTESVEVGSNGVLMTDSSDSAHPDTTSHSHLTTMATPPEKQATPTDTTVDDARNKAPPPLKRSTSYMAAMETEDMVMKVAEATPKVESERVQSSPSSSQDRKSFKLGSGKIGERAKSAGKSRQLSMTSNHVRSGSDGGLVNGSTASKVVRTYSDDEGMEEEEDDVFPLSSQKFSLSAPPPPPPPPPPMMTTLDPSPPVHPRLSPQFSITSLPGRDMKPTKYYTSVSPRVDKVTGSYSTDTNPFAQDFDRALRNNPDSHHAPSVARSNTTLPDDIINDEGFQEFLKLQDAMATTSLYITYQITLISQQIDSKYGDDLNRALDEMIPDVINDTLMWENFSAVARQLMFKDGLFMVPAFGRRLLGFLPGMRDVITDYTQAVLDDYAMDWLLMRGGWGELLRHYDQEGREGREGRGEGEGREGEGEYTLDSEEAWMWCYSNDVVSEEEREEMFDTAMGYGLITPGPEDVGHIVEGQVGIHDDVPHPLNIIEPTMGSELFLAPIHEIAPPIGRGLRRVVSVEVLFSIPDENGCQGTADMVAMRSQSLARVSSLPSMSSSIPSPSTPIPIPSRHKHRSTDQSITSSGMGISPSSSPLVFTLPSMRDTIARPHPPHSPASPLPSSSSSSSYRRQFSALSTDSSIHIVTGGAAMSPPTSASSPLTHRRFKPSQLARQSRDSSGLLSMTTSGCGESMLSNEGCGQLQATPTHKMPDVPEDGVDNHFHGTTPTSDNQATPLTNEEGFPPVQRSTTNSSDGYADYGLESGNDSTAEWEWNRWIVPTAVLVALGTVFTCYILRK